MSLADRVIKGPALLVAGLTCHAGLLFVATVAGRQPFDAWRAFGLAFAAVPYSTLATMLMVLGIREIAGPSSWIESALLGLRRKIWIWCAAVGVLIVAIAVIVGVV